MKQKGMRRGITAALTLLLCLHTVFSYGRFGGASEVYAASKKVKFVSSIASQVKSKAKSAGASTSKIAVAKVVNYTNVYSKTGENGTLMGRLYRGSACYVIRKSGSYSYISSGELTGWVKNKCLVTGSKAKKYAATINPRVATVTSSTLNIRTKKSTSSEVVAEVPRGTRLIVLGVSSKWVKVRFTGLTTGYVYRSYTKVASGFYKGLTMDQEKALEEYTDVEEEDPEPSGKKEETTTGSSGKWVSLGQFKLTAYCPCAKCNGAYAGSTATGATPKADHTIAVDKSVIPLGSKIRIGNSNTVYVAEDTGVKGKKIDIFFSTHKETTNFGVQYAKVYILKN